MTSSDLWSICSLSFRFIQKFHLMGMRVFAVCIYVLLYMPGAPRGHWVPWHQNPRDFVLLCESKELNPELLGEQQMFLITEPSLQFCMILKSCRCLWGLVFKIRLEPKASCTLSKCSSPGLHPQLALLLRQCGGSSPAMQGSSFLSLMLFSFSTMRKLYESKYKEREKKLEFKDTCCYSF